MELSSVLAQIVAETLSEKLKDWISNELSNWVYKDQLEELKICISNIQSPLLLAEKQHPVLGLEEWVIKVRDVLYEADDVLDEFVTMCAVRRIQEEVSGNKVRSFYNSFNQYIKNKVLSYEISDILETMSGLPNEYVQLFKAYPQPEPEIEEKVFVDGGGDDVVVVGRERDICEIVDMISDTSDMFPVITVVGMGGLGKTALVRRVYDDSQVTRKFDCKIWVHVSRTFDAKAILAKIMGSLTGGSPPADLESLQSQMRAQVSGKKYLLVLDDVWCESMKEWLPLKDVFLSDTRAPGSRILVTSRSRKVAAAMGCSCVYDLPFLSEYDSWELFQMMSFRQPPAGIDTDFARLGEEIAAKCAGVPLAIVVVASLLSGQGKEKWMSFRDTDFGRLSLLKNSIWPCLKRSYDNLSLPLKNCFLYCSVFPKDYPIEKDQLILMWMAQGFIHAVPGRSLEEVGADYFETLRQRCFFQDLKEDTYGGVLSCRLHDLMHDLALDIAGREISVASSVTSEVNEHIRHVSVVDQNLDAFLDTCSVKRIRTYANFFFPVATKRFMITSITDARRLRLLDLRHCNLTSLPSSVGSLVQLRYLNLSSNTELTALPSSITNLYNLQSLCLKDCSGLLDLPCGLCQLLNLRYLDNSGCYKLSYMPLGMGKMTSLYLLSAFVLGNMSYVSGSEQLENLKSLSNLTSDLTVRLLECSAFDTVEGKEVGYLKAKSGLENLYIHWCNDNAHSGDSEALLEGLEPHSNLKILAIKGYSGVRFSWASLVNSSATNLVRVCLLDCPRLQHLPKFSQLPHLHELVLDRLLDLEFVEVSSHIPAGFSTGPRVLEPITFFPSLEKLRLCNLPKLRKWWRLGGEAQGRGVFSQQMDGTCGETWLPLLPRLGELIIRECPMLTSVPFGPSLRNLELYKFSEALQLFSLSSCSPCRQQHQFPILTQLTIDNVGSHPLMSYQYLSSLTIQLSEQEQLSSTKEKFGSLMPSLQFLEIKLCCKLRSLSHLGGEHLGALQKLCLSNLPIMDLTVSNVDGDEEDGTPWKFLKSLHTLELDYLPKLVELPTGIHCLTTLQSLEIRSCHNLKALPDWISCLTDLRSLYIKACSGLIRLPESMINLTSLRMLEVLRCSRYLREKCQQPTGEDWPKIRHIPRILID